ncbi:MAG: hypothetical protein AAGI68_09860 [Planctomycetota bacterium]
MSDAVLRQVSGGWRFPRVPQWLMDRNPFFLLSGVMLLFGCFAVTRGIDTMDGKYWRLVGLIAAVNVYEGLAIGVGLWLSRSRALVRDARWLLGLAVLLAVDVTLLGNAVATDEPMWGGVVAAVLALLACVKVKLLLHGLGVYVRPAAWLPIVFGIGLSYAMPVLLWAVKRATWSDWSVYLAYWWLAIGVGLLAVPPRRWFGYGRAWSADYRALQHLVARMIAVVPIGSAALHLLIGHRVYDAWEMMLPGVVPLALAAVVVWARRGEAKPLAKRVVAVLTSLGAMALTLPMLGSVRPIYSEWPYGYFPELPAQLVAVTVAVMLLAVWLTPARRWWLLPFAGFWAVLGFFPRAVGEVIEWVVEDVIPWLANLGWAGWGVSAVVAAFGMLGLGVWIAWLGQRPRGDEDGFGSGGIEVAGQIGVAGTGRERRSSSSWS